MFAFTRRGLSAVALVAAVFIAGCSPANSQGASETRSHSSNGGVKTTNLDNWTSTKNLGTPVDVLATRDAYFQSNPGSNTFSITKRGIMSFNFHRNGANEIYYMGSRKPISVPVTVKSASGNTVCYQKTGKFHGGCVALFKAPSGGYMADTVFGNGQTRTFKADGLS